MTNNIKTPINNRNTTDDLIRVISIIFVIMQHTGGRPWADVPLLNALITTIIYLSNSFFFMLSGKYNIGHRFSTVNDYRIYYKKKFVDILFPYMIVSFLLSAWNMMMIPDLYRGESTGLLFFIKFSIKELLSENGSTHLWFMFCLMGFILSAPFLSKMMNAMSNDELHILFGVAIVWNTITILVFPFFNVKFLYSGWFLGGSWIVHFCLGYYLYRIGGGRELTWAYIAGVAGLIVNTLGMTFASDRFVNATDLTPSFIVACFGTMAFLSQKIRINNEHVARIISYFSKHIFVIYMVHYNISKNLTPIITGSITGGWGYSLSVITTLCLSVVFAVLLGIVLTPCKAIVRKILKLT